MILNPATSGSGQLLLVRALKFKALVSEQLGLERLKTNPQLSPVHENNLKTAWELLDQAVAGLPESDRGSIDCAELHELRGRVYKERTATGRATADLIEAERLYHRIIGNTQVDTDTLEAARLGVKRVEGMQREVRLGTIVADDGTNSGSNGTGQLPSANGLEVRPAAQAPDATTLSKTPAK